MLLVYCGAVTLGVVVYVLLKFLLEARKAGLPRWVPVAFIPCFFLAFALVMQSTRNGRSVAGGVMMLGALAGAAAVLRRILDDGGP